MKDNIDAFCVSVVKDNIDAFCVSAWFMSHMAFQFYTSWIKVFGDGPTKMLYTWHVDKAWRANLHKIHDDVEKRAEVYKYLRMIMEETDSKTVMDMMEIVFSLLINEGLFPKGVCRYSGTVVLCLQKRQCNQYKYVCGGIPSCS